MSEIGRLQLASRKGLISSDQIKAAIEKLPCFAYFALRPGPTNEQCQKARKAHELTPVASERHPIIPNMSNILPRVCLECPVFAPAFKQLVSQLPKR